jgi:hypothetical protein
MRDVTFGSRRLRAYPLDEHNTTRDVIILTLFSLAVFGIGMFIGGRR